MKEEGQSFRSFVLTEAEQLVSVDRAATHGSAIDNFSLIAEHWTAHINARNKSDIKIQATDVCDMMELFKIGRRNASPSNIENYTDACGYAALSYEMFSVLISDKDSKNL